MVNSKTYKTYVKEFSDIGNRVSQENLDQVLGILIDFPKESRIFVCGNGGSASTAEHFSADFSTGSNRKGCGLAVSCLNSNISILTQIANDVGYKDVFAQQLNLEAKEGDILITFTASGNSSNILSAISEAKTRRMKTVAFTGFDGGATRQLVDHPIHVETEFGAYGLVEDIHLSLVHYLVERFRSTNSR